MGVLYVIPTMRGWYPALLLKESGSAIPVRGTLYDAETVDVAAVDAFEGEDYRRRRVVVDSKSGIKEADAYIWQVDLPEGAEVISHGDFVRWLNETGNQVFK